MRLFGRRVRLHGRTQCVSERLTIGAPATLSQHGRVSVTSHEESPGGERYIAHKHDARMANIIFKRTYRSIGTDRRSRHMRAEAQCGNCIYAAGPQTGVVLDVSPRTAMCVRNVDVQMCPAVHTMTRS